MEKLSLKGLPWRLTKVRLNAELQRCKTSFLITFFLHIAANMSQQPVVQWFNMVQR